MYTNKEEFLNDSKMGVPISVENLSEELKDDPDIIVELIKKNQSLVNSFSDKLIKNPNLISRVFNEIESSLYHRLSPELKNNKEFMLKVVNADYMAIYHLGDKLKDNIDFKKKCIDVLDKNIELEENEYKIDSLKGAKEYISKGIDAQQLETLESVLGKEKYNLVSHYKDTLKKLEDIRQTTKYPIFAKCVKNLNNKNLELAEWIVGANNLIKQFNSDEYQELLSNINTENIDNVDIERLNKILEQPNYFNIKNENDVKNYETIKEQVCDSIIKNDVNTISEFPEIAKMNEEDKIKFAVLQKHYNYDIEQANDIDYKYYNIDEIKSEDKNGIKSYIKSLKSVLREKSKVILNKIYNIKPSYENLKDKLVVETELKQIYMKEYNNTLFNPKEANTIQNEQMQQYIPEGTNIDDLKFIDAGTEFNMIMTSVAPYFYNYPENFAKDWNREITNSQCFSCSYIGNDMMGTTAIPHICYGFSEMSNDSMFLSGDRNLGSATNIDELSFSKNFVSYDTPQGLKNSTMDFNEMVFNRIQDGKRKQPDYLILFKKDNKIDENNMQKTLKAVKDFRNEGINLPIVVVDVDRCIENEKNKLDIMINDALNSNDKEKFEDIRQKIRNNSVANRLSFKEYYKKSSEAERQVENNIEQGNKVNQQTLSNVYYDTSFDYYIYEKAYEDTNVEERRTEIEKIIQIQKELMNEKEHEEEVR